MIAEFPPGLLLIVGAILLPFIKGNLRSAYMLLLPLIGIWQLMLLEPGTFGILNHPGEPDGNLDVWFILQGLNNAGLEDLAADLRELDLIVDARRHELGDDPDFLSNANLMVTFNGGASPGQSVTIQYNFGEGVTMTAFAVPEPSTLALALLGSLGCAVRWRRRRR